MKFPLRVGVSAFIADVRPASWAPPLLPETDFDLFSQQFKFLNANRNIKASFLAESEVLWFLRVKPGGAGGRLEAGLLALDGYL